MSKSFYIHKKRHLDSHRSTVTTQTQNKTRQNYYAIFLLCRGGIPCLTYLYSHTHKKLYQAICIIITYISGFCSFELHKK